MESQLLGVSPKAGLGAPADAKPAPECQVLLGRKEHDEWGAEPFTLEVESVQAIACHKYVGDFGRCNRGAVMPATQIPGDCRATPPLVRWARAPSFQPMAASDGRP